MDHLCYFCILFAMLSCLLIAALWSPAEKRADLLAPICALKLCLCYYPMWYPGSGVVFDHIVS